MDIFVHHVPVHATKKEVENFFREPLVECGINHFHVDKIRHKHLANITVLEARSGQVFLDLYGVPQGSPRYVKPKKGLYWDGKFIHCHENRHSPTQFSLRSLAYDASQKASKAYPAPVPVRNKQNNANVSRFAILEVHCGVWDYAGTQLSFTSHFKSNRQGTVSLGRKEAVILLQGSDGIQCRIDLSYQDCHTIILGTYSDPSVSFTLRNAPKFYQVSMTDGEDILSNAFRALALGTNATRRKNVEKTRLTAINDEHAAVAGSCFVYRVTLADLNKVSNVRTLLGKNVRMPPTMPMATSITRPARPLVKSFEELNDELTGLDRYGTKAFSILFQIERLARNGVLSPLKVKELLPCIFRVHQLYGLDATLSALRHFHRAVPFAGPDTPAAELSTQSLENLIENFAVAYDRYRYKQDNVYELTKRFNHLILVHRIIITPAGTYLEGPEPEPANRVLRRYAEHSDHFARVLFLDEDRGASIRYDPRTSQEYIYHNRFKSVLDGRILIAGRGFDFLGFSHSSLRSQSCWFMAPLARGAELAFAKLILEELGDFSQIRVPAKCAARIGQNFTDTNATIDLNPGDISEKPTVIRNGRDFSDGVGTISADLLRRVWRVYGTRRMIKPTALQIRFQGYKGMVSLDNQLDGQKLVLRSNMKKFEAFGAWNLEICGAAFRPLSVVLNRQFIKILEDLGVPEKAFMDLQAAEMFKLRTRTESPVNTAQWLEKETDSTRAAQVPSLISKLGQIGLNYHQDSFLYGVVELTVMTKLREIKYRGRIPVDCGVTLYGIMDETGELLEGEIYVATEKSPDGGRDVLVRERVFITRSPAMHPGDVQVVKAVDVSSDSRLKHLSNVVVFSQHGERDLPSQLSGGDLDGDLYNIIWDEQLMPRSTFQPADYPKVAAAELDRPVDRKDMSDFFILFMESDLLGLLCNVHLQLADQHETGTFNEECIRLANMASTAVDFSKTGIPVDMKQCPKYDRCRPDFMAPSLHLVVGKKGYLDLEQETDEADEAFGGLDAEPRSWRYYPSNKVLGKLYRAIDEGKFLAKMQQDHRELIAVPQTRSLLETLLDYMKRQASQYSILFDHQLKLAVEIRAGYEESLFDILYCYGPMVNQPLSEHEVFAGTILGRHGGAQGKPLRELSKTMRERAEAVVEYTTMRIVKGDEQMQGVSDLDLLYDDSLDRELEALPRAIACLSVAVEKKGMPDRLVGELQSFKYVAAGVCLRELERYLMTTCGSSVLPSISG